VLLEKSTSEVFGAQASGMVKQRLVDWFWSIARRSAPGLMTCEVSDPAIYLCLSIAPKARSPHQRCANATAWGNAPGNKPANLTALKARPEPRAIHCNSRISSSYSALSAL